MTDFNNWTAQTWALLAVLGALVFMVGIALWRWRTPAIVLALVGAALVAVSLWKGDPIWASVAAVGTLLLGWGLAVLRRRPRVAPWMALVGILAALSGIGAGNLWSGGKAVVDMFANTAARVSPPPSEVAPTPPTEPSAVTPPTEPSSTAPEPSPATPPTEPSAVTPPTEPSAVTPPTEPVPPTEPAPPGAAQTETPQPSPPAEPAPPPPEPTPQPPAAPSEVVPDTTNPEQGVSSCPCTLDVGANVGGANVTLLRGGQVEATGQAPASFFNLPAGAYTLRVETAGYKPFETEVPLTESRNIVVRLEQ